MPVAIALLAALIVASGIGRALVRCQSGSNSHVEFVHGPQGCSHQVEHQCCDHAHPASDDGDGPAAPSPNRSGDGDSDPDGGEHPDDTPGPCVDQPLLTDTPAPETADDKGDELAPVAFLAALMTRTPPPAHVQIEQAHDPPRPCRSTELRRIDQLLL